MFFLPAAQRLPEKKSKTSGGDQIDERNKCHPLNLLTFAIPWMVASVLSLQQNISTPEGWISMEHADVHGPLRMNPDDCYDPLSSTVMKYR